MDRYSQGVLAVGALLAWTAYFIAGKQGRAHIDAIEYVAAISLVAAVIVSVVWRSVTCPSIAEVARRCCSHVVMFTGTGPGQFVVSRLRLG